MNSQAPVLGQCFGDEVYVHATNVAKCFYIVDVKTDDLPTQPQNLS